MSEEEPLAEPTGDSREITISSIEDFYNRPDAEELFAVFEERVEGLKDRAPLVLDALEYCEPLLVVVVANKEILDDLVTLEGTRQRVEIALREMNREAVMEALKSVQVDATSITERVAHIVTDPIMCGTCVEAIVDLEQSLIKQSMQELMNALPANNIDLLSDMVDHTRNIKVSDRYSKMEGAIRGSMGVALLTVEEANVFAQMVIEGKFNAPQELEAALAVFINNKKSKGGGNTQISVTD
jgi:hypothetical protein